MKTKVVADPTLGWKQKKDMETEKQREEADSRLPGEESNDAGHSQIRGRNEDKRKSIAGRGRRRHQNIYIKK